MHLDKITAIQASTEEVGRCRDRAKKKIKPEDTENTERGPALFFRVLDGGFMALALGDLSRSRGASAVASAATSALTAFLRVAFGLAGGGSAAAPRT